MESWRTRFPTDNLETQSWKMLEIEGQSFLVKGLFNENSYEILVTDLASIWEESLHEQDILKRSKVINPLIEAPTSVILHQLCNQILKCPYQACSYSSSYSGEQFIVTVGGPLQGSSGPQYQWDFILTRAPPLMLKHHLVCPLLSSSIELLRRQEELIRTIKRKDKEITDYKESGAVVSRKHLLTNPFKEDAFLSEMTESRELRGYSLDPIAHLDQYRDLWQDLYTSITSHRLRDDDSEASPGGTQPSPLAGSLQSVIIKSPSKSPLKRGREQSPSKEMEQSRREDLQRKLDESKSKTKKKKKKLM